MTTELRIPDVGESIQEVQISHWLKQEGDQVQEDENIVELETEKASMELPSPITGILKILKKEGEAAAIGETIAYVDEAAQPSAKNESTPAATSQVSTASQVPAKNDSPDDVSPQKESVKIESSKTESDQHGRSESEKVPSQNEDSRPGQTKEVPSESRDAVRPNGQSSVSDQEQNHARPTPSARRALREYGLEADEVEAAGKQLRREDVLRHVERQKHSQRDDGTAPAPTTQSPTQKQRLSVPGKQNKLRADDSPLEEVVPMTMIRRRIAERLVAAQSQAALLTTYNEIDMSSVLALRKEFGDRFRERYEVKLGFMSFFVKAVIDALKEVPELNAEIRGTDIVYRHRYDIGIAVGSQYGLVVPVVRNADRLSFAEIERTIADFAARANDKKLLPQELSGGTFTISNGGIYGSLLSTPIVNPPQSGVLGMHTIQERPVARDGQVVIRPMMYVALTYDHRIIDGREAVTWLRRVKETIEQPSRMLIEA